MRAPEGFETPCVIYSRLSTDPSHDLDEAETAAKIAIQLDVYDHDYASAIALAATIRRDLVAWYTSTINLIWTGEEHGMDPEAEPDLYRVSLFFHVHAHV